MIEPDGGNIALALRNHAAENEAAIQMESSIHDPTGQGSVAIHMQQWSRIAPTIPAGALLSLSRANIGIDSDVGRWIVQNAFPALVNKSPVGATSADASRFLSDPNQLGRLKQMDLSTATDELNSLGKFSNVGGGAFDPSQDQPITSTSDAGTAGGITFGVHQQTEQAGLVPIGDIGEAAKTGIREAGAVAQSGQEFVQGAVRQQAAGLAKSVTNVVQGKPAGSGKTAGGVPLDPQHFTTPKLHVPGLADIPGVNQITGIKESPYLKGNDAGGAPVAFGGQQALQDLGGQTTLGQQLQGYGLGQGLLPGGEATVRAQNAQRAAATVAGHALTPGRALASAVTTPDSAAFRAVSGAVDAYVSLHADPAFLATESLTDAVKAGRTIAPFTGDSVTATAEALIDKVNSGPAVRALRDWTGVEASTMPDLRTAIIDKLSSDPISIRELIDNPAMPIDAKGVARAIVGHKAGLLSGLYDSVHPQNFQNFLVGPEGDDFFQKMADMNFTDIGHKSGWTMDAKLQLALSEAHNPDEARQALQDNLSSIRQIPTLGVHPVEDMRWASILPTKMADVQDANSLLERARQDLQLFKIPRKEWDNFLPAVVKSEGDYTKAYDAFIRIGNRAGENMLAKIPGYEDLAARAETLKAQVKALGDHIVPTVENDKLLDEYDKASAAVKVHDEFAKSLANYFYERGNQSRLWHNAEGGGAQLVDGLNPAGGMTAIEGPFGTAELLNRGIPTPGGTDVSLRDIQRAVGTWAPLFNREIIGKKFLDPVFRKFFVDTIADNLTDTMKTFALGHVGTGVRIVGSSAARMAAAGVGDLSENPLGLLGMFMDPEKGNIAMTGEQLIHDLGGVQNKMAAEIGRATDWRAELQGSNRWTERGWAQYLPKTGDPEAINAWANRLSHTSSDPVAREVAKALVSGESLDAVKQSVWDGPLQATRQEMIDANVTWGKNIGDVSATSRDLVNRSVSDAWVDGWAKIVQTETANHQPLLERIAEGGFGSEISDRFKRELTGLANDGVAPDVVTGPIKLEGGKAQNVARRATNALLTLTAGGTTRDLLNIPTMKRLYMAEAERLLPYLSEADAKSWTQLADAYGVQMPAVSKDVTHTISLEQADQIAKTNAVHDFQKIFYNPGRRPIIADQLRDIIPFANVVGEHVKAFARLTAQNPKVLRVVQMGVTDAEQSLWSTKDQYGKQQISIIPGGAMNAIAGAPFGLSGELSKLNLAFQGVPSVGPVVSLGMPDVLAIFGKNDIAQKIQAYTDPYGDPTTKGNVLNALFPGWFDKAVTTGWLANIPIVSSIATPDQYQRRLLNQTAMQVMRQKMSTGHIDMHDPDSMEAAWKDSLHDAKYLYLWRSMVQFMSPVAPQFDPVQKLKDGSTIQQYIVAQDYQSMLKANNYDENKTAQQFITKYGPENIFAAQPFTRPKIYGLPTTAEAEAWRSQNSSFADKFSQIYGYFAPQKGGFDYPTYLKQIADGERDPLTGPEWYSLAEARVGNALYDNLRRKLPASLNDQQQGIVQAYRAQLTKQFPGFNQDHLKLASDTSPQTITDFKNAIQDPTVAHTVLAKAIGSYLRVRDAVLTRQQQLGLSANAISTSSTATPLRDVLYKWGTQIADQHPEFANVWQNVFSYEVQNQQTQALAAAG